MEVIDIKDMYSYYDYTKTITYDHLQVPWKKLKRRMKLNRLYQYVIDTYSDKTTDIKRQIFKLLMDNIEKLDVKYDKRTYKIMELLSHKVQLDDSTVNLVNSNPTNVVVKKNAVIQFY